MSYSAPTPLASHWFSVTSSTDGPRNSLVGNLVTITWPSANLAIYVPVIVRVRSIVKKMYFLSASTGTGNYDLGLYSRTGVQLLSQGSTAKPAAADAVVWDCGDLTIGPDLYYIALANSTNTDTFYGWTTVVPIPAAFGMLTEASAMPLPSSATFAVPQTLILYPEVGLLLDTRSS